MSNYTKSLPTEVWLHTFDIFKYDKRLLGTCRLVCKTWNTLIERILYKKIDMSCWKARKFSGCFTVLLTRPELGQLVQEIHIDYGTDDESILIRILKLTPNLKILQGMCSKELLGRFLTSEFAHLQLQELPRPKIPNNLPLYAMVLLDYKSTLRSADIDLTEHTDSNHLTILMKSISECKITTLCIRDNHYFRNVEKLEWILQFCNHIEELKLEVFQHLSYSYKEQSELETWLMSNVKKMDTVKKLDISYYSDGLHTAQNPPRKFSPDWMEYLAFKCPKVENLSMFYNCCNRQQLYQLKFQHLHTIGVYGMPFYDSEALKHYIDTIDTNVVLELSVGDPEMNSSPYICSVTTNKERGADYTRLGITMTYDARFDTNLQTVLSIFSTKTINRQLLRLDTRRSSSLLSDLAKANFKVESLEFLDRKLRIKKDHLDTTTHLRNVSLVETKLTAKHINRLNRIAPNLTHLELSNCSLTEIKLMPSSQLTCLELHSDEYNSFKKHFSRYRRLLFHVSFATSSRSHYFIATKNTPLLEIINRKEKYDPRADYTIRIKCGSLQQLKVNFEGIKFQLKFDVEQGHIKSSNIGMIDSIYLALTNKHSALVKKHTILKADHKLVQKKYSKAKSYLSTSQIESIEKD